MTRTDAPWQPRLHWWSHLWRYLLCLVIGMSTWLPVMEAQAERRPGLFWLDIAVAVLAGVLVWFRRRRPLAIAVALCLLTPFTSLGAGFIALGSISLATRRVWWELVVVAVLNMAGTVGYYAVQPVTEAEPIWLLAVFTVLMVAASLAFGMFIGSRRELVWTLEERARTAEAERDRRAAQARSGERTRIAREMHDVLAHRISQISMHAGALTYREDLSAAEMRASATVIQQKAHEALTDLREVLGVLRDDSGALSGPQPTYADVADLVEAARAAGASIRYDARVADADRMPEQVGRTVFRVVQEGITNATKHAPGATLRITVDGDEVDGVTVLLRNPVGFGPTRTPGSGLGLVGLTERAEVSGGSLRHGTTDAGFELRAWLPWSA
ncbi:sensor histidine kinase [Nocardioides sambongensis]|uniref:sensor histidine kinase n=1 Tax=Nocardioides sambongensis TaxID=2589074 RepID=UPI001E4C7A1B|nr:histidine kinase [Nocardioides sambongensis]